MARKVQKMKIITLITLIAALLITCGCVTDATNYQPIIHDKHGELLTPQACSYDAYSSFDAYEGYR